ncbi:MAG: substrate-binding domain-containing protein [Chitinophagales bacterium]
MFLIFGLSSCKNKKVPEVPLDDIHKGEVVIWCDEALEYVMNQQVTLFEHFHEEAHLHLVYKPEAEIVQGLLNDSIRTAIIGRSLSDAERRVLMNRTALQPKEIMVARDAAALVVSKSHSAKPWPLDSLIGALSGAYPTQLVFDDNKSGFVRQLLALAGTNTAGKNMFALQSTDSVVRYVSQNTTAIGIIGFGTIADEDYPYAREILKLVNVLPVAVRDTVGRSVIVSATQGDLASGKYPLQRPVNYVLCNQPERVADGFVNFLAREKAAKVFLKSGLVPAVIPERVISVASGIEAKN